MQEEEDKPKVKVAPVYAPIKFFISSLNTFLGNTVVRRLRNDHIHPENPNRIIGTTCCAEPDMKVPDGVRKVIDVVICNICRQTKSNSLNRLSLTQM